MSAAFFSVAQYRDAPITGSGSGPGPGARVQWPGRPQIPIHLEINRKLDRFIFANKIPHIIFHGMSGAGKLTLVKSFIQRIYRHDRVKIKTHVMTVNCSHGKGIQFIREEIKFFAKTNIATNAGTEFKTIVLLNAHHLTVDAQSALRRCIELFSYNTRFFIVVENKHKLLTPILSRFCDIYVPEYVCPATQCTVNLHTYALDQSCPFRAELAAGNMRTITDIVESDESCMDIANRLYDAGMSCLDLMRWHETLAENPENARFAAIQLEFHTIKPEFRCEKLLMLHMLLLIRDLSIARSIV